MLTSLETRQLNILKKAYGEFSSPDELIALAIKDEEIKNACGPFDPAWQRFATSQADLERYALLLEKQQNKAG